MWFLYPSVQQFAPEVDALLDLIREDKLQQYGFS